MKIFVIPLYLGDNFHKENWPNDISRVCKYLKRALLFFGTRKNFTVFYPPNDKNDAIGQYIHHFDVDKILIDFEKIKMDIYAPLVDTNYYGQEARVPLLETVKKQLDKSKITSYENVIIFINMNHAGSFITAIHENMNTELVSVFSKMGTIGNTECFFFNTKEIDSVEELRFHKHLDFFIPKDIQDLNENIMNLGKKVHQQVKKLGHTDFLQNYAKFLL